MKKTAYLLSLFLLLFAVSTSDAAFYTTIRLIGPVDFIYDLQMNNKGHAAWSGDAGGLGWEVFFYDGSTTTQVSHQDLFMPGPRLNQNDQVVYHEYFSWHDTDCTMGTCTELYLYDHSTSVVTRLENSGYGDEFPRIADNGHVVWLGYEDYTNIPEVFIYKGWGKSVRRLTYNDHYENEPRINSSGHAVWDEYDGSDREIYLYDGSTVIRLTDNDYSDNNPEINDNGYVVWSGANGPDHEIFLYDGSTTTQLTSNDYSDSSPLINSSGHVVWEGDDGSDPEIFLYDGSTVIQLTDNEYNDSDFQINSNDQIIWLSDEGSEDKELFLYSDSTITKLGTACDSFLPQLSANGHVLWCGYDGSVPELFLYDGSSITQLSHDNWNGSRPQIISNGHVAWIDRDESHDYYIYYALPGMEHLKSSIADLNLPDKDAGMYMNLLEKISESMDKGNSSESIHKLETFKKRVLKHIKENLIPEETGQSLITVADDLIGQLSIS